MVLISSMANDRQLIVYYISDQKRSDEEVKNFLGMPTRVYERSGFATLRPHMMSVQSVPVMSEARCSTGSSSIFVYMLWCSENKMNISFPSFLRLSLPFP